MFRTRELTSCLLDRLLRRAGLLMKRLCQKTGLVPNVPLNILVMRLSCKTCFAINPSFRNDHDIGDNPSSQEGAPPQSPCRVSCLVVCGIFLFLYEVVVCGIFLFLYEVIPFVNMFL